MPERGLRPIGPIRRRRPSPQAGAAVDRAGRPKLGDEGRSERVTLIEFDWVIRSGIQPVILASRELLH